jgi:hypothetical protein
MDLVRPEKSMVDFAGFVLGEGYELSDWQLAMAERLLAGEKGRKIKPITYRHGEATVRTLVALYREVAAWA